MPMCAKLRERPSYHIIACHVCDQMKNLSKLYLIFIGIRRSKCEEEILHGTDWESVNYSLTKLQCNEDEITGLCVNDKYLVAQYHIEGGIDIYDRVTLKHLYR